MSPTITVEQLSKTYKVPEREGGFSAAIKIFFKRKYAYIVNTMAEAERVIAEAGF